MNFKRPLDVPRSPQLGKQDEQKTLEAGEMVETVQQKFCSGLSPRHAPGYAGHVKNKPKNLTNFFVVDSDNYD